YGDDQQYVAFDENGPDKLSLAALNQFLSATDMKLDETDPIKIDIYGQSVLSYNLFDSDEYAGSLTLEYRNRPYRPGDEPLIRLFAHYLMLAMKQHSQYMSSGHSVLRKTFQSLMDDMPVDLEDRRRLENMDLPELWRCIVLQPTERLSKVPASYVCETLEDIFPGSIAFSYEAAVILFTSADRLDNSAEARRQFVRLLEEQFDTTTLKVGISSPFSDLFSARWHYTQGCIALENGSIFDPDETFYFFEEYALEELIINAPGDQPLEMYFSDGLKRLFEHDAQSQTSYIETLRTYLNNNMNVTATADALYIHRSTLLERLSRIKKELWDDLKDPDVQLRLRIILKALEIRERYFG
ncbi:MAG: helix-turn-helix domain-containing protein, partial [Acutalibacteraceae bacterium]|nr:helix-turn-helix domain-containing protein [Acutalibacteraceae bacterium]